MTLEITDGQYSHRRGSPVFESLSLRFPPGVTVILGPNGAGKSTLLDVLGDNRQLAKGHIEISGVRAFSTQCTRNNYRRRVSHMPQVSRAVPGLTSLEHLIYVGWLKGLTYREARARSHARLEQTGLSNQSFERADGLSGGQLRRLSLAATLMNDPEVILLDEPTAGLDIVQRDAFREAMSTIGNSRTIIMSTHQTDDIHEFVDYVVLLIGGKAIFSGPIGEFVANGADSAVTPDLVNRAYRRFAVGSG